MNEIKQIAALLNTANLSADTICQLNKLLQDRLTAYEAELSKEPATKEDEQAFNLTSFNQWMADPMKAGGVK